MVINDTTSALFKAPIEANVHTLQLMSSNNQHHQSNVTLIKAGNVVQSISSTVCLFRLPCGTRTKGWTWRRPTETRITMWQTLWLTGLLLSPQYWWGGRLNRGHCGVGGKYRMCRAQIGGQRKTKWSWEGKDRREWRLGKENLNWIIWKCSFAIVLKCYAERPNTEEWYIPRY